MYVSDNKASYYLKIQLYSSLNKRPYYLKHTKLEGLPGLQGQLCEDCGVHGPPGPQRNL